MGLFFPLYPTFTVFVILWRLRTGARVRRVGVQHTDFSTSPISLLFFWSLSPFIHHVRQTITTMVPFVRALLVSTSWFWKICIPWALVYLKMCPFPKSLRKSLTSFHHRKGRLDSLPFKKKPVGYRHLLASLVGMFGSSAWLPIGVTAGAPASLGLCNPEPSARGI